MVGSFTARRSKPELVAPARSTPRETKPLSDLDDDSDLRYLQPGLEFFRPVDGHHRRADNDANPAKAIKAALAEALVYYYPIAGRLRELHKGKLAVDCTDEGVVFVEAEAGVRLEDLGQPPLPPYSYADEFLCDVGDDGDVVGMPLFFMQVTRLKCGGFVVGSYICHNIADGFGTIQFLKDIFDLARGKEQPATLPVWERELLMARNTPQISHKYETLFNEVCRSISDDIMLTTPPENMVCEYFSFSPRDVAALRRLVPLHVIKTVTSFELLTAIMWRSRSLALGYQPSQRVRLMITMNARRRWSNLSDGFYGNALLCPIVETTVNDLCTSPLGDTIGLVRKAKLEMTTEENVRSMVDLMAILRERPPVKIERLYSSSYIKWLGEDELDIGWAKRISGGIPAAGNKSSPEIMSDHFVYKNEKGENMIVVSMLLPRSAMDRFRKEMVVWLKNCSEGKLLPAGY